MKKLRKGINNMVSRDRLCKGDTVHIFSSLHSSVFGRVQSFSTSLLDIGARFRRTLMGLIFTTPTDNSVYIRLVSAYVRFTNLVKIKDRLLTNES